MDPSTRLQARILPLPGAVHYSSHIISSQVHLTARIVARARFPRGQVVTTRQFDRLFVRVNLLVETQITMKCEVVCRWICASKRYRASIGNQRHVSKYLVEVEITWIRKKTFITELSLKLDPPSLRSGLGMAIVAAPCQLAPLNTDPQRTQIQ